MNSPRELLPLRYTASGLLEHDTVIAYLFTPAEAMLPGLGWVTMLGWWDIEGRIAVEEAGRLQRKTGRLNRHHRPIFGSDNMVGSEGIPHHNVRIVERTVLLRIARETIATGRLVRVVSRCVALYRIVGSNPHMKTCESAALPLR